MSFGERLPSAARVILLGDAVSAMGTGMTQPFLLLYLANVVGLGLGVASTVVAALAASSFVGNAASGPLSDRWGPRNTEVAALLCAVCGTTGLVWAHSALTGFLCAGVLGLGVSLAWPARDALLASAVAHDQRSAAFGVRHATFNAGMGCGALIAAVLLSSRSATAFHIAFAMDALATLAFAILIAVGVPTSPHRQRGTPSGGYRRVFADRIFVRVWLLSALLVSVGFGQLVAGLPAYVYKFDVASISVLAIGMGINTVSVVCTQLMTIRFMRCRPRTTGIAITAMLWAACWALCTLARFTSHAAGDVIIVVALAVFGVGETFLSPALGPMVNDMALATVRGRYNAALVLSITSGCMLAPLISGGLLAVLNGWMLMPVLTVGCLTAAAASRRLSQRLPRALNGVGAMSSAQQTDRVPACAS